MNPVAPTHSMLTNADMVEQGAFIVEHPITNFY
jgi:hypothetical protein